MALQLIHRHEHEAKIIEELWITHRAHPWFRNKIDRQNFGQHPQFQEKFQKLKAFAGWDLGKRVHPSHLSVLLPGAESGEDRNTFYQIASVWFKLGVNYVDQVAFVADLIAPLNLQKIYFDDSQPTFETMKERGELHAAFKGQTFTSKAKNKWAGQLNIALEQGRLFLLDDARQTRSIAQVDNLLKAEESSTGHGDAFWSLALALEAATNRGVGISTGRRRPSKAR